MPKGAPLTYLSHADRRDILTAVLRGSADEAFDRYRVPDLEQASFQAAAQRLLARAAAETSPIKAVYAARRRMPLRRGLMLAAVAALVPFGAAVTILWRYDLTTPTNYPLAGAAATLLGVVAAAAGWGVASWTAYRNARSQHTLNFLATRFSNNTFSEQTAIFNRYFAGKRIDAAQIATMTSLDGAKDIEALQALRYILNWFEFIAVGVLLGDLDIDIVTKTVRSNLIFYVDRCMPYIRDLQRTNPKIMENLLELRLHFREP